MDRRSLLTFGAIGAILLTALASFLIIRKHDDDLAAQAAQARYEHLESVNARVSYAMDQLKKNATSYESAESQGVNDSQERHRLWNQAPYDLADALTSVRSELNDVNRLTQLAQAKATAARAAATALGSYFGDSTLNSVSADITAASEAELKYLADWNRAASAVNDVLTARVNGRWDFSAQDDIESLYRACDEDRAVSESRWSGVVSRLIDLQSRLRTDVLASQPTQSTVLTAATDLPVGTEPATSAPAVAAAPTLAPPTAPAQTAAVSPSTTSVPQAQAGPLARSDVLPLLRATAALTVSTNPDGHTAYVTVPDTPASGTADADRIITGQLADGRWVVFVPLASGSSSVGDIYSLMWVWTDGRAQFVGEIPAENGGLGRLSTSVRNGEIYISWPVCCPSATRLKVVTLDGIRLRPLSDTTS